MNRLSFLSPPSPCEYLRDRMWQLRYEFDPELGAVQYMERLARGWRRFGPVMFRPECPSCSMCRSLRIPVETFCPTQSQRRAWKMNHGALTIQVGQPSSTLQKLALFDRFHRYGHQAKGWPYDPEEQTLDAFTRNPFPTEEWCYYLGDRLLSVSYVDALPDGLSAIYCFHDPLERHRSLGTFNILSMVESARVRGLPHVYLGYWVDGSRSMSYKARFRPNEILQSDGRWLPAGASDQR
jgi:leucyl-tRNA---protein transferase